MSNLKQTFEEFKNKFGYSMVDKDDDLYCLKFERTVEHSNTHVLILEDHSWERSGKDFDPKRDIGDWLIFSYLTDCDRDWFGRFVETQYPLTYTEYRWIERIIHDLENERGADNDVTGS